MSWSRKRKVGQREYLVKNVRFGSCEAHCSAGALTNAPQIRTRARHNRVRNPRWDLGGHRYCRYHALSAKAPRIMERDSRRYQWSVRVHERELGQSTVEFAIITAGLLALVVALGVLWNALNSGLLIEHALAAASHHLVQVPAAFLADIFRY